MTADRIRFSRKAAPANKLHRCPATGNVWAWCSTPSGGYWRREADGEEAPCSDRDELNAYDELHPVVWVAQ